jgi:hypothetical protein
MKFPLILYMSPEGPKWQPKYFADPKPLPAGRSQPPVIPNIEVSNSRREDSLSMYRDILNANPTGDSHGCLREAAARRIDVPVQLASK